MPPTPASAARPVLHRLRRADDAPALGWLAWPARLLAALPGETVAAVAATAAALLIHRHATASLLATDGDAGVGAARLLGAVLAPLLGAVVTFRITRALFVSLRRPWLARAAVRRACQVARDVGALGALPSVVDGQAVACVGRVRCRQPFTIANQPPVAAAQLAFAGSVRSDLTAAESGARGAPVSLWQRPPQGLDGGEDPARALLSLLTRPAWVPAVFEAARDFDLVDDDGATVHVAVGDAQLVASPRQALGGLPPVEADAVLATLQAPLAAAGADRGLAHYLREGDRALVIGFKDTEVDAGAPARLGRESPLGATLRGHAGRPLLIVPLDT